MHDIRLFEPVKQKDIYAIALCGTQVKMNIFKGYMPRFNSNFSFSMDVHGHCFLVKILLISNYQLISAEDGDLIGRSAVPLHSPADGMRRRAFRVYSFAYLCMSRVYAKVYALASPPIFFFHLQ